jgi:hypothetical protein
MAVYETTGGDMVITIPNCDCGLTGGCEKCYPITVAAALRENTVAWKAQRILDIRQKSSGTLGQAWKYLANY